MLEYVLTEDMLTFGYVHAYGRRFMTRKSDAFFSYNELGNTRGIPRFNALKPIRLKWSIPESVILSFSHEIPLEPMLLSVQSYH